MRSSIRALQEPLIFISDELGIRKPPKGSAALRDISADRVYAGFELAELWLDLEPIAGSNAGICWRIGCRSNLR
jgi:hypothetical protein